MKYIIRNINAYTGEVLKEMQYDDLNQMVSCVEHYENIEKNRDENHATIVVVDGEKRIWDAEYIGYLIDEGKMNEGIMICISLLK